jgi:hypothetical protein
MALDHDTGSVSVHGGEVATETATTYSERDHIRPARARRAYTSEFGPRIANDACAGDR